MKCPQCNLPLVMAERHGVEIDYCPECRGVWLDRGELDKILERSSAGGTRRASYGDDDDDEKETNGRMREETSRKRRGGFFSELFDF
ncbi:MAG: zf-TFIIB domain-containing protein [Pirellulales bacterium]